MKRQQHHLVRLWAGLSTHWVGSTGVVLTTSAFVVFVLAELLRLIGAVTNSYVGLITYLLLPALFVFGLLLIPIGWWIYRRKTGRTTKQLMNERFASDFVAARRSGSRLVRWLGALTLLNILFLIGGAGRMLTFMDSAEFCGTACHSVMSPEWTAYQHSPHAHVPCVDCHVGEGTEAAFDAKLNGAWQMISVTFDLHERPIPTPVHNLRPARETCEKCHWPSAVYGDRIKTISRFADDRESTPRFTTLALKVGSGQGKKRGEIHWHVAKQNEVRYQPADQRRSQVRWLEVRQPDGSTKRYRNRRLFAEPTAVAEGEPAIDVRVLDCVDCHNRATHVFEDPTDAVDRLIASGAIDRAIPFARRQAYAALTGTWSAPSDSDDERSLVAELDSVERDFRSYYRANHPKAAQRYHREIDDAVVALQDAYRRNIHPRMQVTWGSYPSHLGHRGGNGCDRCHNPDMVDETDQPVAHDCTLCHSMMAYESSTPFRFLQPVDPSDPEQEMHRYLYWEMVGGLAPSATPPTIPPPESAPPTEAPVPPPPAPAD
ncbi:MAG: NapC/NirT family cytochrome c [Deltaproteobacteria bacterium]|nr:NapC/NirT family cytochrome c [Deltaproteobacteria bacterium]